MRNVPHCLKHLNICPQDGSTLWGSLDGAAIMEEIYYWGWALRVKAYYCIHFDDGDGEYVLSVPCNG